MLGTPRLGSVWVWWGAVRSSWVCRACVGRFACRLGGAAFLAEASVVVLGPLAWLSVGPTGTQGARPSIQDSCVRTAGVAGHLCGAARAGYCAHGLCSESWEVLCSRMGPHWAVSPCENAAPRIAGCVFGCLLDSSGPYMHTSLSRLSSAPHLLRDRSPKAARDVLQVCLSASSGCPHCPCLLVDTETPLLKNIV